MTGRDTSIIIKHGTVISMDPALGVIRDCDILIEGNTIVKVETQYCCFVDSHHHLWQQLLRSVGSDWSLMDYALIMRTCFGSLYTPEDVYTANYAGAIDLLNNGITTVVDHCHILNSPAHTDAAIAALKNARIRGAFCYGLYANPPLSSSNPEATALSTADTSFTPAARRDDARRALKRHFPTNTWEASLLTFGIACNEPETAQPQGVREEIAFARSLGVPLITAHVAIGHYDTNLQVVQHLGDAGDLGADLLFSHGAAWTDSECALLAEHGAGVVSTPRDGAADGQWGIPSPSAPSTSTAAARTTTWVAQARLLLQAQRARDNAARHALGNGPPLANPRKAMDVLRLATQGGADALGVGHLVGSLTPGKRADVVVTACEDVGMVPAVDPVGMLVCNSNPSSIRTVLVDGQARPARASATAAPPPSCSPRTAAPSSASTGTKPSAATTVDMIRSGRPGTSSPGGTAAACAADVSVPAECERVVRRAVELFGRLDVLVNNVGVLGAPGSATAVEQDGWERGMRVNVGSMVWMAKYAIPRCLRTIAWRVGG
ncbi:Fumarylacetoacetase [Botryosphaeria dothidea]|uniref:Fumarylacetoacetase n=1 Tax=Botryosphaeria dothidea TaxID=55169 RepID=A0A8H4MZ24_9PEZI|nr:Fumarylacetoacetase [Botryosphaeria dothidea]